MPEESRLGVGTPDVVVLAPAWDSLGLVDLLGETRVAELGSWLLQRTTAWATAAFGAEAVSVVTDPAVLPGDLVAGTLAAAAPDRPLLIAVPELAAWRPSIGEALLDDLADGCAISIGAVFDGGFYALALAQPHPALLELPAETWSGRLAMAAVFEAAAGADLLVGLVRSERALRRPEDIRALLADPLLDDELRALLAG